jgi:hypothetical protein
MVPIQVAFLVPKAQLEWEVIVLGAALDKK